MNRLSGDLSGRCRVNQDQPDTSWPFTDNDLDALCRECRVSTAGERPGGFESLWPTGGLE